MRGLEEKLLAVEGLFKRGSKGYQCAFDVVMKGRRITMSERALICQKVGCSVKTLEGALTKLRKAGLYGSPDEPSTPEKTEKPVESKDITEEDRTTPEEEPEPEAEVEGPGEKYVTVDQFNRLVGEIRDLAGLNPNQESAEMENPGYEEEYVAPPAESVDLLKASMKQMGTWIEAKNLIYFDFARNGAFGGALEDFNGNWSDFVNIVLDDYFSRLGIGIGMIGRRLAP